MHTQDAAIWYIGKADKKYVALSTTKHTAKKSMPGVLSF